MAYTPPKVQPFEGLQATSLPGGLEKLEQVWELCRTLNPRGYVPESQVVHIKGWTGKPNGGCSCSPFTGQALGMALDPRGLPQSVYEPQLAGGEALEVGFYKAHNGRAGNFRGTPIPGRAHGATHSVVYFNLGKFIDPEEMRKGDVVGIDWKPKGGHAVFCFDVHIDPDTKKVDCFQLISANGSYVTSDELKDEDGNKKVIGGKGIGVSVHGSEFLFKNGGAEATIYELRQNPKGAWDYNKSVAFKKEANWSAKSPLFQDSEEYVAMAKWHVLPGIDPKKVKRDTFRKRPVKIVDDIKQLTVARLHGVKSPPPFSNGNAPPQFPPVPSVTVPGKTLQQNPQAVVQVPPKPVDQHPKTPTEGQLWVEERLKWLFRLGYIDKDPGDTSKVNDVETKAAVTAFQKKAGGLKPDGIAGKKTKAKLKEVLNQQRQQMEGQTPTFDDIVSGRAKAAAGGSNAPSPSPTGVGVDHFYWETGTASSGTEAQLFLHGTGMEGHSFQVKLKAVGGTIGGAPAGTEIDAGATLVVKGGEARAKVKIPEATADASGIVHLVAHIQDTVAGTQVDVATPAPLGIGQSKHPPMARGEESENVRVLQFLLNQWQRPIKGLKRVTVSARLDDATVALMKEFQKASSLSQTDAPDEATWQALEKASKDFAMLGSIHPCDLPVWTKRRWHANYQTEGRYWTRTFPQTSYDKVEGLEGRSRTPIFYITKLSTDHDGTGSKDGDPTADPKTPLRWEDGESLNGDEIPYLAIGGAHDHDFGLQYGDIGAVIHDGKLAFGVYGDSSGHFVDGEETDEDRKLTRKSERFRCHRSGEASVKVHRLLGMKKGDDDGNSDFIWIVFPGSTFCTTRARMPRSVDSDAIQKRGAALLKLLGA